ncbi:MAG TPA: CsbD family protein, partial [Pyrinomonadaceae bacterium]
MDDNRKDSIGEEVSSFGQRAKGDIKEATGTVTGNSSLRAEGAAESATGATRQKSNRMVTGLFRDRDSAERAYGSLSTRGYDKDDVNLLMTDETRKTHFAGDDSADT